MAKPTVRPRAAFSARLAVWVLGIAGGTGRSATAGLLAAALTERLDPLSGTGPVVLFDGAPAPSSPWPAWLQAPLNTGRERTGTGQQGHVLDRVDVGTWPVRTLEPGPQLQVATDAGGQLAPGVLLPALRDVAAGVLPAVLSDARAYVIDGPAAQLDGIWWAAHRDRHAQAEQLLARLLDAGSAAADLAVVVLHVRADAPGLTSALDLVTCLGRLDLPCDRMVVCAAIPAGGMSRHAKVRAELLRGHVGALVLLPYLSEVAKAGAPAYTDPALRHRATHLLDAVLDVAARADSGREHPQPAATTPEPAASPLPQIPPPAAGPAPRLPPVPLARVVPADPYAALRGATAGDP